MLIPEAELSIEAYHADPAQTNTKLKDLHDRGPAFYKMKYIDRTVSSEATEAMERGSALELYHFDHAAFERRYAVKPEGMTFASTAGKDWQRRALAAGKKVIKAEDLEAVGLMSAAMRANPTIAELTRKGVAQLTARYVGGKAGEPDFGLAVQTRPDWFNEHGCRFSEGRPYFADLKKTRDFSEWFDPSDPSNPRVGSPIWKYGYHRQAGILERCFAQHGFGNTDHFLIVVEEIPPYRCHAFRMGEGYRELGWRAAARDLALLQNCLAKDEWPALPGIGELPIQLEPPAWMEEREAREFDAANQNGPQVYGGVG